MSWREWTDDPPEPAEPVVLLPFVRDDVHRLRAIAELLREANADPSALSYVRNLTQVIVAALLVAES